MSLQSRAAIVLHRYLRVPYTLHTHEFQNPKKPKATYVLIHGIGNSLHSWDELVAQLPHNVRIIGIDLLGFGRSPKPSWAVYDATTQARSVGATLLKLGLAQRPIIVGHSLGALVAVEIAKRYAVVPKQLVLCSPPFYRPRIDGKLIGSPDDMLRLLYETARKHPEQLEKFSPFAVRAGIANKAFNVDEDNVTSYFAALESSIINQTSLQDVAKLRLPIDIFYGIFDPVVIKKNITDLAKSHENIRTHKLPVGHEIVGGYVKSLAEYLNT